MDQYVLQALHSHNTAYGIQFFEAVTFMGSTIVLTLLGAAGVLWIVRRKQFGLLTGWCAALIGARLIEYVLKNWVQRARPEFAAPYLHGFSYSFPSGHALNSMVTYGMLAYVAITLWTLRGAQRVGVVAGAGLLILAIGFSRLYLGVHYLSDVAGGFAIGFVWLGVCASVTKRPGDFD